MKKHRVILMFLAAAMLVSAGCSVHLGGGRGYRGHYPSQTVVHVHQRVPPPPAPTVVHVHQRVPPPRTPARVQVQKRVIPPRTPARVQVQKRVIPPRTPARVQVKKRVVVPGPQKKAAVAKSRPEPQKRQANKKQQYHWEKWD